MTYELSDVTGRETEANEYFNTLTGKFEVIRMYGVRKVQETFLRPDGTILLIAYDAKSDPERFAVGTHGKGEGEYFASGQEARTYYAQKIAESFALTVGPPKSVIIRDGDRALAGGELNALSKAAGLVDEDPTGCSAETLQELVDAAQTVIDRMAGLGIKSLYRDLPPVPPEEQTGLD